MGLNVLNVFRVFAVSAVFTAVAPFLSLVVVGQSVAQQPETSNPAVDVEDPLFQAHDMITLNIVGPIEQIREDRGEEPEYRETTVTWSVGGETGELPVQIRPRGNFRKRKSTCRMPPLRLNFAKKQVTGTLFDGQDKLKLVTHCRDGEDYEQNVFEEYLSYRLFNLVTDQSFRARLVQITYTDTEGSDPLVRHGFLIEDEDRMAARLGGTIEEMGQLHPHRIAEGFEPKVALFQYMIGNTDYSMVQAHNVKVVRLEAGGYIAVPYDFDWSGLVNAGYARPNETLGIRNVRQRLYRGFCRDGQDFNGTFEAFLAVQPEIAGLYDEVPAWKEKDRERATKYLADFFEVIEDPKKADRQIVRACRQVLS
ncbi:MAG: hypothetical protein ACR2QM_14570 [Longimicrobiales bacterium]